MKSPSSKTGRLGEDIAAIFLQNQGYKVLDRNYRNGYGEIDLICEHENFLVFVEVKTVSREITNLPISRETSEYRPEENVHGSKLRKVFETAERYMFEMNIDQDWRVDVLAVEIDQKSMKSRIRHVKSV